MTAEKSGFWPVAATDKEQEEKDCKSTKIL